MISIEPPQWSWSTWLILGLAAALLVVILVTPILRRNVASWVVWLGVLLGGRAKASHDERQEGGTDDLPDRPDTDPTTAADDAQTETDAAADDEQEPTASEVAEDINKLTGEVE